jgi:hypothetical protein
MRSEKYRWNIERGKKENRGGAITKNKAQSIGCRTANTLNIPAAALAYPTHGPHVMCGAYQSFGNLT